MSAEKHDADGPVTPWSVAGFDGKDVMIRAGDGLGRVVVWVNGFYSAEAWKPEPIAKRIVACVNACAGMENPADEIAALRRKAAAFDTLMAISNIEDQTGAFEVRLFYNNYQDGAHIAHDGKTIADCYDLPGNPDEDTEEWPKEQFLRAIEKAATIITKAEGRAEA